MSETLWSATIEIARLIPGAIVVDGTATGGSASTLADTAAWFVSPTTLPSDDYYNGGTIWFNACVASALDMTSEIITDYVSSSGTFIFTTKSAAIQAGDTYSATNRLYPRFILRQAVNYALAEAGGEDKQDATLTSVADQMTYDLPSGVYNVRRVEVATSTSTPYNYIPLSHWREINDDIAFDENHQISVAGYLIRLTYRVPFTALTADTSALPDLLDMNWVKWAGVAYCLRWKLGLTSMDEPGREFLVESLAQAEKQAERYRPKLQQMPRDWPHSPWAHPGGDAYTSEVNKVRL